MVDDPGHGARQWFDHIAAEGKATGLCGDRHGGLICSLTTDHDNQHEAHGFGWRLIRAWPNRGIQHIPELGATYTPADPEGRVLWIGGVGYRRHELPALILLCQRAVRDTATENRT